MAALTEAAGDQLRPLRAISPVELWPVLEEEIGLWREELDWDFSGTADLISSLLHTRSLPGYALNVGESLAGYCYWVQENHKALVGNLYVRRGCRSIERENRLLEAVLQEIFSARRIRRVEAQLMLLEEPLSRPVPFESWLARHARSYMAFDLERAPGLPPGRAAQEFVFEPWAYAYQAEAAAVIAAAYHGHVDAQVNDQYRTLAGARRFLVNLLQYPGCGLFLERASFVAQEPGGRLVGLCLASRIRAGVAHITQLCVVPEAQKRGVGYELLRRSLDRLWRDQYRRATLTVTEANDRAFRLYERVGFRVRRRFAAFVWERSEEREPAARQAAGSESGIHTT